MLKRYEVTVGRKKQYIDAPCINTLAMYRGCCSAFLPTTKVKIYDVAENEVHIYTRQLDEIGNLICMFEDGKEI